MNISKTLFTVSLLFVCCSCSESSTFSNEQDLQGQTYSNVINNLKNNYKDLDAASFDTRLIKSAEIEATIQNQGLARPIYKHNQKMITKVFPYNNCNDYSLQAYDYSECVSVTSNIKQKDYSALKFYKGKKEDLVDEIKHLGYTYTDTIYLNAMNNFHSINLNIYSQAPDKYIFASSNKGLVKFNNEGYPIYNLIDTVSNDGYSYVVTIKEEYWKDYNGNSLRKITAQDFLDSYNLYYSFINEEKCFDSFSVLNNTSFEIKTNNSYPLFEFSRHFNYPVAMDYIDYSENNRVSIENMVYSGDYSFNIQSDYILLNPLKNDNKINKIYVSESSPNIDDAINSNLSMYLLDSKEGINVANEYICERNDQLDSYTIFINSSIGDQKYKDAIDNKYFRLAMLEALDLEFLLNNFLHTSNFNYSETKYMMQSIFSLTTDNEQFKQGTAYHEIVDALLEKRNNSDNYLKLAVKDLGKDFFKDPVVIPCPIYDYEKSNFEIFKCDFEDKLNGYVSLDISDVKTINEFNSNNNELNIEENRFIYVSRQFYMSNDIADIMDIFTNSSNVVNKIIF